MPDESQSDNRSGSRSWADRLADGAVGAFFTLLASLAFFYFTSESPNLTYEIFPPSSFVSEQTERTIYTVRVANQGDAEAEEIRTVFDFPGGATVQDSKVNTSSEAITYTLVDTSASAREYTFPLLNPGESAKFSFLLSGNPETVDVAVRGRGIVGEEREAENVKSQGTLGVFSNPIFAFTAFIVLFLAIRMGIRDQRRADTLHKIDRLVQRVGRLNRIQDEPEEKDPPSD